MKTVTSAEAGRRIDPPGSPLIAVRGLSKRFGDVTAVDDLSFEVQPGRVTGFLGPNGAGKSTTLRMLLGLVLPDAGSATVFGLPHRSLEAPPRTVGAVLEVQSFNPLRTGRNHVRVLAAAAGLPDERVDEVLAQVGLTEVASRKAGGYSLGMRQRLGLASALLGDPKVLILDEPANGLDPQGIRWLREFLREFVSRGNAVLVSSHLLSEMAQMADEVIVIDRGRMIRQGTVSELTAGRARLRVTSPDREALELVLTEAGFEFRADGDGFVVIAATPDRIGSVALQAGVVLSELSRQEDTLEEAFLEMTDGSGR